MEIITKELKNVNKYRKNERNVKRTWGNLTSLTSSNWGSKSNGNGTNSGCYHGSTGLTALKKGNLEFTGESCQWALISQVGRTAHFLSRESYAGPNKE